tara:strand:+ start:1029 stop:1496 length:468 start_codon:yes stop_codon:yes gene_type:complete
MRQLLSSIVLIVGPVIAVLSEVIVATPDGEITIVEVLPDISTLPAGSRAFEGSFATEPGIIKPPLYVIKKIFVTEEGKYNPSRSIIAAMHNLDHVLELKAQSKSKGHRLILTHLHRSEILRLRELYPDRKIVEVKVDKEDLDFLHGKKTYSINQP